MQRGPLGPGGPQYVPGSSAPLGGIGTGAGKPPMMGTVNRPSSRQNQQQGQTAMRQGTAQRMGTGQRMGTAVRLGPDGNPLPAVGMTTNVAVSERPVTQQGMMGVAAATAGPGRQLKDRSYWLTELRVKITEIQTEIGVLRGEIEQRGKDENAFVALSKRQNTLNGEVGQLRGHLADLNLLVEKSRVEATPDSLHQDYEKLRGENERMLKQVDKVFTDKKSKEAQCRELEKKIADHYAEAEMQLQGLSEDQKSTYYELSATNKQYLNDITQLTEQIKAANDNIRTMEDELKHDPLKTRAISLRDSKSKLEKERDSLASEVKNFLSGPEQKERLLAKVKEDNADIELLNKQLGELKTTISSYKEEIDSGANDLSRKDKIDKYRVLLERDKEIQTFIDSFPEQKKQDETTLASLKNNITALLEDTTKLLERKTNLPSKDEVVDMKDQLSYKVKQMDQSNATNVRLQEELETRQSELEKMGSLDQKITSEQNTLEEKMTQMRKELVEYGDTEGMRVRIENEKKNLVKEKGMLRSKHEALRTDVYALQVQMESAKNSMTSDPTYSDLETLEGKLKTYESVVFTLNEYIMTKSREANYDQFKTDVLSLVNELNNLVIQATATKIY